MDGKKKEEEENVYRIFHGINIRRAEVCVYVEGMMALVPRCMKYTKIQHLLFSVIRFVFICGSKFCVRLSASINIRALWGMKTNSINL